MKIRLQAICLLLILILVITAGMADAQGGEIDGTGLRFVGYMPLTQLADLLDVEIDLHTATLSPDGMLLAWYGRDSICVLTIEDGNETCYSDENLPGYMTTGLYWSPTSQMIAFHEDAVRGSIESDIWLLDLTSGHVTNLTDDMFYGSYADAEATVNLDLLPTWDPATGDLYFFRVTRTVEGSVTNALYRFRAGDLASSTEAELVVDLTDTFPDMFPVYDLDITSLNGSTDISPDGTTLAFITRPDLDHLDTAAVWLMDLASGDLRVAAQRADIMNVGAPAWYWEEAMSASDRLDGLAWLPDNKTLIVSSFSAESWWRSLAPALYALDTSSGAVRSLRDLSDIPDFKSYVTAPYTPEGYPAAWGQQMFSLLLPGGEAVVYTSGVVMPTDTVAFSAWLPGSDSDTAQPIRLAMIPTGDFEVLPVYRTSAGESDGTIRALSFGYLLGFERVK